MTKTSEAAPVTGCPEPIGYALWHLEEARKWTLAYVDGISQETLDLVPEGHPYNVSTLLYHIAVFEVDWLYVDVLGRGYDEERRVPDASDQVDAVLDHPLLAEDGTYTIVRGESLRTHQDRLALIRSDLIEVYRKMTVEDFRAPRPSGDGTVTPEWVLMHLARHDSEHRGQIWVARTAAESAGS